MNEFWNLEPIYRDFDDPTFTADMEKLQSAIADCDAFVLTLDAQEPVAALRAGIKLLETISQLANKLAGYASLRQAANTRDPQAASKLGQVMGIISETAASEAAFRAWAAKLPELEQLLAEM